MTFCKIIAELKDSKTAGPASFAARHKLDDPNTPADVRQRLEFALKNMALPATYPGGGSFAL